MILSQEVIFYGSHLDFPALWTAGADTATGTTDLVPSVQDVVDTMGEEVKQTSSILSKIFQPILDKLPSLIFCGTVPADRNVSG